MRKSVGLLVVAMGLVCVAVFVLVRPALDTRSDETARSPAHPAPINALNAPQAGRPLAKPPRPAAEAEMKVAAPAVAPVQETEPAPPDEQPPEEAPMFGEAKPGEGIAVFPPPGTKPIKRGILVPEDFELPPGSVPHYQATDDGQRVPAILMFHPDYRPVDEHGEPITLPADRVVPPDMAPPGMPVQMLEVPETQAEVEAVPEHQAPQDSAP